MVSSGRRGISALSASLCVAGAANWRSFLAPSGTLPADDVAQVRRFTHFPLCGTVLGPLALPLG
eukprot:859131-Heterocapsa_arctica.AAC.1